MTFFYRNLRFIPVMPFFVLVFYSFVSVYLFNFGTLVPFDLFGGISSMQILVGLLFVSYISFFYCLGVSLSGLRHISGVHYLKPKSNRALDYAVYFWVFISIFNYDIHDLFFRSGYSVSPHVKFFEKVGQLLLPIVCLRLALPKSWLRFVFRVLFFLLLFSLNTRALLMFSTVILFFNFSNSNFLVKLLLIFLIAFSAFTPVFLRSAEFQGLFGNFISLAELDIHLVGEGLLFAFNYVFSMPIASLVKALNYPDLIVPTFIPSVVPIPSSLLSDPSIFSRARFNDFAPISALGSFYTVLGWYSALFWFFYGFLYGLGLRLFPVGYFRLIIAMGFVLAFFLGSIYGLRNFMVFSYGLFFCLVFFGGLRHLFLALRTKKGV